MITFDDVWVYMGNQAVLKNISFTIDTIERVAVLGSSGEGKTTILRLIIGLTKPDSGRILIDGEDITDMDDEELQDVRRRFSIVFQEGALFDSLTVGENVAFYYREHTDFDDKEIETRVRELLNKVGLEEEYDKHPTELSGGMRRRVAIARALSALEAQFFLYDEPTTGLDPINAAEIRKLVLELATDGRGFIIVTHEILDAVNLAEKFLFIKDGRIIYTGNRADFLHSSIQEIQDFLKPSMHVFGS